MAIHLNSARSRHVQAQISSKIKRDRNHLSRISNERAWYAE
jgi:hypothetical protein